MKYLNVNIKMLSVAFVCFFMLFLNVYADNHITIDSVESKQHDVNSLKAKQKAIQKVMCDAFYIAVEEISDSPANVTFSDEQISNCVYDYSINNEKYSDSTYICNVSYRFVKANIISLLKGKNIAVNVEEAKEVRTKDIYVTVYTQDFFEQFQKLREFAVNIKKMTKVATTFCMKQELFVDFKNLKIAYYKQ